MRGSTHLGRRRARRGKIAAMPRLPGSSFEPLVILTVVILALVAWGNSDLVGFTDFADEAVRDVGHRVGLDL